MTLLALFSTIKAFVKAIPLLSLALRKDLIVEISLSSLAVRVVGRCVIVSDHLTGCEDLSSDGNIKSKFSH